MAADALHIGAGYLITGGEFVENPPASLRLINLAMLLAVVVVYAGAQAIAFSRFGKRLDRPLWKSGGDKEALQRFFVLWLLLNLVVVTVQNTLRLTNDEQAQLALFMFSIVLAGLAVPLGACIMFSGRFSWQSLGEDLAPIGRQLPYFTGLWFFAFFALLFLHGLMVELPRWALPLVSALSIQVDCLVFCMAWLLCMRDRDEAESGDDLDF